MPKQHALKLKRQFLYGNEIAMGPGKAICSRPYTNMDSFQQPDALGMSNHHMWRLANVMNCCWNERLVETLLGGGHHRGARLTETRQQTLFAYRAI